MYGKLKKGSNAGMPILAVVAVMTTLAGTGIIYSMMTSLSGTTGQDHDKRELVDLGSAIENKCSDLASNAETKSITPISVDFDMNTRSTLTKENNKLKLSYSGDGEDTYDLTEACDVEVKFDELTSGKYQLRVSGEKENGNTNITVEVK